MMPDWVRRIREERDAALQAEMTLAALTETDGPRLWRELLEALEAVGESCKSIGVEVYLDDISGGKGAAFQVRVSTPSRGPRSLSADVSYLPDQRRIRCYPQVACEPFHFDICLNATHLFLSSHGQPVTPEQAANEIIAPLAEVVAA